MSSCPFVLTDSVSGLTVALSGLTDSVSGLTVALSGLMGSVSGLTDGLSGLTYPVRSEGRSDRLGPSGNPNISIPYVE